MTAHDDGAIVITQRDVWDKLLVVERKVDVLVLAGAQVVDHETRLRSVERRMYALPSLATLIAVASLALALWNHSALPAGQSAPTTRGSTPAVVHVQTARRTRQGVEPVATQPFGPPATGSAAPQGQRPIPSPPTTTRGQVPSAPAAGAPGAVVQVVDLVERLSTPVVTVLGRVGQAGGSILPG